MNIDDLTLGQIKQLQSLLGSQVTTNPNHPMIGKHCVVRTYSDGVHLGTVDKVDGMEVLLKNSRRLWQWKGAFTLSEVALNGVAKDSRIAIEVPEQYLTQVISFTPTTEKARKSFEVCNEK